MYFCEKFITLIILYMNLIPKTVGIAVGCVAVLSCAAVAGGVAPTTGRYWNDRTQLVPIRLPLPPAGFPNKARESFYTSPSSAGQQGCFFPERAGR